MGFFNKVGEAAKSMTENVGSSVEISRLNRSISDEESKIEDLKSQLGAFYWDKFDAGETLLPDGAAICGEIRASYESIRNSEAEIERIKAEKEAAKEAAKAAASAAAAVRETVVCPGCGAELSPDKKFCPECGAKVEPKPEPEPEPEPKERVCPFCGAPAGDQKFCGQCGARLDG